MMYSSIAQAARACLMRRLALTLNELVEEYTFSACGSIRLLTLLPLARE